MKKLWYIFTELLFLTPLISFIVRQIAERQCELLTEPSHSQFGDVLYCWAWTTRLVNREKIDFPDVFLVPDWYMHIGIRHKLIEGYSPYGRCIHDMDTKKTIIMLNKKYVNITKVFGSSILVHEYVHSVQYADGRGKADETVLELEARVFQKEFYDKHIKLTKNEQQGIVSIPVQSLGEPK